MRAFVTGGSGFIGSRLLEILVQKGWKAKALVHKTPLREDLGIETISADLGDTAVLSRELEGTDVLFHLAAAARLGRPGTRMRSPGSMSKEPGLSSGPPREARVRKIVHFSSAGVIGKVAYGEIADEGYPLNPQNAYDRTKLARRTGSSSDRPGRNRDCRRPGPAGSTAREIEGRSNSFAPSKGDGSFSSTGDEAGRRPSSSTISFEGRFWPRNPAGRVRSTTSQAVKFCP